MSEIFCTFAVAKVVRILTYDAINREEWSKLVRESKTGTWFQSLEAYSFYESLPDLFRPFVVGISNLGFQTSNLELRGVCVGYITVEQSALKQCFTRRAIILGGPCLTDDATEEEVEALVSTVRGLVVSGLGASIYIETRNFNDYSQWKRAFERAGFVYQPHLNFHVDCTTSLEERLSENRRRQIRRASETGAAKVIIDRMSATEPLNDELQIREWYEILAELYRTKVKTPLWPVDFFLEAYRQGIGTFLLIKHHHHVIGGTMVVGNEGCVYEWFECGRNNTYKEQYPSVMATWAGMNYAKEQGCKRYDMMGAGEPGVPYGVRDFKSEFGGTMVEHGRFLYVHKPCLYRIGKIAVKLLKRVRI